MARKASKRTVSVDFEGVESGGRSCPDGAYPMEITDAKEKVSKSSGEPMIALKWKVFEGKQKGVTIFDNCSLQPQALWKLKGLLEALGEDVPDSSLDIDLDDLVGRQATNEVTNETYEGKQRPRITGYASIDDKPSDDADDDDDKEKAKPKAKKPSKATKEAEPEDDDDTDDEPAPKGKTKKVKVGAKVSFKDEKNKVVKGTITEIDGDTVKVEDTDEDEWELEVSDLTLL